MNSQAAQKNRASFETYGCEETEWKIQRITNLFIIQFVIFNANSSLNKYV